MFILGALFPKMAKTPLQPICANPEQLCQGQESQALLWASSGLWGHRAQPAYPAEQQLVGLLVIPPLLSRLEIPQAVLGSSIFPLAAAVSLCFASDSSSGQPAWALLPVFHPSCKSCLLYLHPGLPVMSGSCAGVAHRWLFLSIYLSMTGKAERAGKVLWCGGSAGCPWMPPDVRDLPGGCSGLYTPLGQGRFT